MSRRRHRRGGRRQTVGMRQRRHRRVGRAARAWHEPRRHGWWWATVRRLPGKRARGAQDPQGRIAINRCHRRSAFPAARSSFLLPSSRYCLAPSIGSGAQPGSGVKLPRTYAFDGYKYSCLLHGRVQARRGGGGAIRQTKRIEHASSIFRAQQQYVCIKQCHLAARPLPTQQPREHVG